MDLPESFDGISSSHAAQPGRVAYQGASRHVAAAQRSALTERIFPTRSVNWLNPTAHDREGALSPIDTSTPKGTQGHAQGIHALNFAVTTIPLARPAPFVLGWRWKTTR